MISSSFVATAAVALLGALGVANAQNESTSYKYKVDVTEFPDPTLRATYCNNQQTQCRILCYEGLAAGNPYCDPDTFVWNCQCVNTPTPNMADFNNTIPYYQCIQYVADCQVDNTDDPQAQKACLKIQCGGKNATAYVLAQQSTSTSAMPSPTSNPGSGGGNSGPSGGGNGGSNGNGGGNGGGPGGAASGLDVGNSYGLAIFIGTAMMLFGVGIGL